MSLYAGLAGKLFVIDIDHLASRVAWDEVVGRKKRRPTLYYERIGQSKDIDSVLAQDHLITFYP